MLSCDDDGDQRQILNDFRRVASAHVEEFLLRKNHVLSLLGPRQNPESGRFREELVREFLRKLLPRNVGVDTGFIYGFEQVGTSDQLDVIIWDHGCHAPVLNAGPFVIVAPESVIAVVSVKSKMTTKHLRQGIHNLASVAPLDLTFRKGLTFPATGRFVPAIAKFLLFFSQPDSHNSMLRNGAEAVRTAVHRQEDMEAHLIQSMRAVDPFRNQDPMWDEARRVLPRHIAVIEPGPANYVQGWGPPENHFASKTYGGGMRRVPWLYRHESRLTTAFEKFVYFLLASVLHWLASPALSLLSAWGDLNPATGDRAGDIEEIIESEGAALLEVSADTLPRSMANP